MKIVAVDPILLRGEQTYVATQGGEEAVDNGDWQLIVKITTDSGLVGWGDIETLASAAAAIIGGPGMSILGFKALGDLLIGEDPTDTTRIWNKLYIGSAYYGRRGIAIQCMSAIDNALWSIKAQAAGKPLAALLGGRKRDRIRAYASTLFRATPAGMRDAAKGYMDKGFTAVKFGWGVFGEDEGRDRELVAAARETLGPDRLLMVDPGWYPVGWAKPERWSPRTRDQALRLCNWLAEYKVYWVEDFIHPEHFDVYAAVRKESPVKLAAGEQVATTWEFERFIGCGAVDVIQPDLTRCGGLTVALEVARMAEKAGIQLVTHSWLTHLLTGHSLQFLSTLKEAPLVEFNVSQSALTGGIAKAPFKLDAEGFLAIPDTVDIGVTVDEKFVQAHRVN
ncbi:MAG: mandelate racemase/muconate lactonizing enzyme family protein [Proteobacteria bacterium]|nr:mandelate racemase/muconate lactonizing enzyme family protein [Pseudomonadota bacterium]